MKSLGEKKFNIKDSIIQIPNIIHIGEKKPEEIQINLSDMIFKINEQSFSNI